MTFGVTTKFFVVIGLALSALFWTRPELATKLFPPCRSPITYSLGIFDEEFGISESEFLAAAAQAEKLWEDAVGKELFAMMPEDGKMSLNLIYDDRQRITETLGQIEREIAEEESDYKSLESEYLSAKSEYEQLKSQYESRVEIFNARREEYERRVEQWNNGPRTSASEMAWLEREKAALDGELASLKKLQDSLNGAVREVNSLARSLNETADEINEDVSKYNETGAERGETFTGGIYYQDGRERGIYIYEFSSQTKLMRVLAHELGHALGLEHVSESGAIMHDFNNGSAVALSGADVSAVKNLCRIEG